MKKTTENKKKGTSTTTIEEAGTAGDVAKLNGELLESDNKLRLFKTVGMDGLTYAQATRWLISLMAYDDTSAKATKDLPEGQKYPSLGVGWLGRLGYIQAQGKTLFETLMLNLTLLRDGQTAWESRVVSEDAYLVRPCWELDRPRDRERTEVPLPKTLAALCTVQSRRMRLSRQGDRVGGYLLLGGDFFNKEDAFVEQMTLWRNANAGKKNQPPCFVPCQHDASKQFWREFPTAFVPSDKEGEHQPGVVKWVTTLRKQDCLDRNALVRFSVCAMGYGDKYFFVKDTFEDGLAFHTALLDDAGAGARERIVAEIELCEKAASAVRGLARDLAAAAGGETDGAAVRDQFYFRVDRPFRQWLEALDPAGDVDAAIDAWRDTARNIALTLGDELARAAGPAAFVGRTVKKKLAGKEMAMHYSTPEARRSFMRAISAIYPKTKGA